MRIYLTMAIAISFFFLFTSFLGFYTSIKPPRVSSPVTPKQFDLEYESVEFETSDGLLLKGWFIPATSSEINKTIIGLHGYPADKGNILPSLAPFANEFNLFLFDFRYFGESEGTYSTAGTKEVADLVAAVEYLKKRGHQNIGIWGFSMGGAVALMGHDKAPEVKAVATRNAYASLSELSDELYRIPLVDQMLGELTIEWSRIILGINPRKTSPINSVQKSTTPILITHSRSDEIIKFKHAELLQRALAKNENAEFWFDDSAPHGQISNEYLERLREFFMDNL